MKERNDHEDQREIDEEKCDAEVILRRRVEKREKKEDRVRQTESDEEDDQKDNPTDHLQFPLGTK